MPNWSLRTILLVGLLLLFVTLTSAWWLPLLRVWEWMPPTGRESGLGEKITIPNAEPTVRPDGKGAEDSKKGKSDLVVDDVERKAKNKAQLLAVRTLGKETAESLDGLAQQLTIWETNWKTLLTDDLGRRLGSSASAVDQVTLLLEKPRIKKWTQDTMRGRLDSLLEPIDDALRAGDGRYSPSAELVADIESIGKQARELTKQLAHDNLVLRTLLDDNAKAQPGNLTLEQAIAKRREEGVRQESEAMAQAKAKAQAKAAELLRVAEAEAIVKIAEAEAEAKKLFGEAEAKRLRDQIDLERKKLQDQAEAAKRQAEKDRLERLAGDRAIQAKYQALLAPGYYQFDSSGLSTGRKGKRPEPVSLGDLTKDGWLKSPQKFAYALSKHPHPGYNVVNDRPVRPYPTTQAEWAEMDRMLEEFRVLAPIWVELKVLRP